MGQESEPNGIKKPAAEKKVNLVFYLFFLTFLFVNREVVDLLREAQEQLRFGRKRTYPGKETYYRYRRIWNQRILFLYPGLGMGRHSVSGMFSGARGTTQQIFLMALECFDKLSWH